VYEYRKQKEEKREEEERRRGEEWGGEGRDLVSPYTEKGLVRTSKNVASCLQARKKVHTRN
jgi:hypothetical protein